MAVPYGVTWTCPLSSRCGSAITVDLDNFSTRCSAATRVDAEVAEDIIGGFHERAGTPAFGGRLYAHRGTVGLQEIMSPTIMRSALARGGLTTDRPDRSAQKAPVRIPVDTGQPAATQLNDQREYALGSFGFPPPGPTRNAVPYAV